MATRTQAPPEFLYHGTGEGAFRRIREEGLKPANGKLYATDSLQYATSYAIRKGAPFGPRVLRLRCSGFIADSSNEGGDFVADFVIEPADLEVLVTDVAALVASAWVPLLDYADEAIGLLPVPRTPRIT